MSKNQEPIRVNELLGKQPSLGLLSANQLFPLAMINVAGYFLADSIFSLGFPITILINVWLSASWLFLTGNSPDKFLNLFRKPFGCNWTVGGVSYISPLMPRKERIKLYQLEMKERKGKHESKSTSN